MLEHRIAWVVIGPASRDINVFAAIPFYRRAQLCKGNGRERVSCGSPEPGSLADMTFTSF